MLRREDLKGKMIRTAEIERISFLFQSSSIKNYKAAQHIVTQECKPRLSFQVWGIFSDFHSLLLYKRCQKTQQRTQITLT